MNFEGKFHLKCRKCGSIIKNFKAWFDLRQQCPSCGGKVVDTEYSQDISALKKLISADQNPKNLWHYFDFLPLYDSKNIIAENEGVVSINRWKFLETFAKEHYNLNCQVMVYRNDESRATGTFKDAAASVVASVLKENGVTQYTAASTGNIGSALACYLAKARISFAAFMPDNALKEMESEINSYGQRVFRVDGDYHRAKHIAAEYAKKYDILLSLGNLDPMRIEAKKTMVFEWLRLLGELPTVYIQALSGGTGPLAIEKALNDIEPLNLVRQLPRFIMVQPDACNPMTLAWQDAKAKGFEQGWETKFPVIENPKTIIPTLATGNPQTYPVISQLVKKSKGEIVDIKESSVYDVARLVSYQTDVRIGPAAAVAVSGFFKSLKDGHLKEGDTILINLGEGVNRATSFLESMIYTTKNVSSIEDCTPFNRAELEKELWKPFE